MEAAEVLVDFGAKLSGRKARDYLGCYPLHYVALGEQEHMLYFLLGLNHLIGPYGHKPDYTAKTVCRKGQTSLSNNAKT